MEINKLFKNCSIISAVFLSFYSCSERDIVTSENEKSNSTLKPSPGACDETLPTIRGMYLANGTTSTCTNNIMVFASIELYNSTIENLETQVDSHNAYFDQLTNGMTDEQADTYAESIGFDEDKPITDFENQHNFCSLRKKLITLENQWLDQQGDGNWDLNTDPDSYYIDDDVERALLNEQSEVLIGTCATGYTLYKFYSWGNVHIPLGDSTEMTNILTQLNNGNYPLSLPINTTGPSQTTVITILNNTSLECPTITSSGGGACFVTADPTNNPALTCKSYVKDKGEHYFSSTRRIKWKHKMKYAGIPNPANTSQKMKVVTTSYKKKNSRWKRYRATLYSGITGQLSDNNCTLATGNTSTGKEKRKKRLKYIWTFPGQVSTTTENKFFSVHKQEGNVYQNDIY